MTTSLPKQSNKKNNDDDSVPNLPPPPDFKFSDVIDNMNNILASVGGSVEIKRKKPNGMVSNKFLKKKEKKNASSFSNTSHQFIIYLIG